ncbi:dTMP kinase [Candidatus Bathycorpusculum sp.]|jgi:dTMP kinase|uniref:dTMP kinase n=1 Tax=Candidatus Bathycorpusculum sp. TaxID=2994959 RepID=UPI0028389BC3|nr:dTMP kinase [Candidatus Termitimicrobium sp.]MCL2685998.1 dTMP kinase [Candidatus Termitimicrobium sp.]
MAGNGIFLVIEGLDGSGKTTQAKILAQRLSETYSVYLTAEPSRGKIGTFIRECCLYDQTRLPTEAEALLFAADRIEHMNAELKPALNQGKLVICDRYLYSSLAYQGNSGLSLEWIKNINSQALQPDFSIFLDVPPEQVLERLHRKKSVMETLETQCRVREVYLKFVEKGELILIDGNKPRETVADELYAKIIDLLRPVKDYVF